MNAFLLTLLVVPLFAVQAQGLILTGTGNKPVNDPGWPEGAVNVANLLSRICWWEGPPFGGGEWHFEFVGDTTTFQHSLDVFSGIKAPTMDLFVHDGTQNSFVLDPNHTTTNHNVDWTFTIWDPKRWEALYGNGKGIVFSDDPNAGKSRPPPRIDLYLGPSSKIDFAKIKVPANVSFHDERAVAAGVDTRAGTVLLATITDAETHDRIQGARLIVTARDENNRYTKPFTNAVSDEKGIARIEGLPAGVFQLSAVAKGYVEAAIAYGDYPEHSFKKFEPALARASSVSRMVLDEQGNGVKGVRVVAANTLLATNIPYRTLNKPEVTTDPSGKFTLKNLPIGLVQIWILSTNYFQTNLFGYQPVPGPEVPLHVLSTGSLLIRVEDANGVGINQWDNQQIQVSVEPSGGAVRGSWGGSANVQDGGTYLFTGVHPGSYNIPFHRRRRESQQK